MAIVELKNERNQKAFIELFKSYCECVKENKRKQNTLLTKKDNKYYCNVCTKVVKNDSR